MQNSPNLGERQGGRSGGERRQRPTSAAISGPAIPTHLLLNGSSAIQAARGEKKPQLRVMHSIIPQGRRGEGRERRWQDRCAVGRLLLPPAPPEPQPRVRLCPRQRKAQGKQGTLPAVPQPVPRAYLQPPVPGEPRCPSIPAGDTARAVLGKRRDLGIHNMLQALIKRV